VGSISVGLSPELGGPVSGLDEDTLASWEAGRALFAGQTLGIQGQGPTFNADACSSCHGSPVSGGGGPRDRDMYFAFSRDDDGTSRPAGTNGESATKNLYAIDAFHIPDSIEVNRYLRRNALSALGAGLLAGVPEEVVRSREDPDDLDGDGVSGRANEIDGELGRFGWKAQAATMEAVIEVAWFNQQGMTSRDRTDDDAYADPEFSDGEFDDLWTYMRWVSPPAPGAHFSPGADRFVALGCAVCHVPELESAHGPLPAYTDLLLHDMGEALQDRWSPGIAEGSEFRTPPLWGVGLFGPWLHDGRAATLEQAVLEHGGEAQDAADAFASLSPAERAEVVAFLESLGQPPEFEVPEGGEVGGPEGDTDARFTQGAEVFSATVGEVAGRSSLRNADSCASCHTDPVMGGSGGRDASIITFGHRSEDGTWSELDRGVVHRTQAPGEEPYRMPDEANIVELRAPPTLLGLGALAGISDASIEALADEEDSDGDGISGRVSALDGGAVGRFGWKAQAATISEMVTMELDDQIGLSQDAIDRDALIYYVEHLASPPSAGGDDSLFVEVGCAACHVPELDGVAAYTDLLLHDVASDPLQLAGHTAGEYRTPPLWGLAETAPYLHDGTASTIGAAIELGHAGEAATARDAYLALDEADRESLLEFLLGL